ncbi:MAG: glycosyltransferase family 4 protein [Bacteroidota bacterium]|nr:glycosyltransferase family 4 protein [Bacteroidota bacterium]MDX5430853.1 glycosyltransferase family 4 protein [Bacteroidota bacterium]MDX5469597.1 glycosyltransferase family 4 protein [Bacteroidota bacterium]
MSVAPRIAHVITPKTWRGGEQQAMYLVEELQRLGVYQHIFCARGSATEAYCREHQLEHTALKKRFSLDLSFAAGMAKTCRNLNLNILHPHGSGAHTFCILSVDLFQNPCQILLHRRVDFPISKSLFSRYKYNHRRIKRIVCVSEAIKTIMTKDLRNPQVLRVVYDGIDLNKFGEGKTRILREEYGIPEGMRIVANIAALTQQKDYFTFIDAASIVIHSGNQVKFLIIGDGKQRAQLEAYVSKKGLSPHILFTGFREDIPTIFPEIDVLLFSSETEGLGSTVLDALAAGVPVVSTNAGGIPEIIQHNVNGYLAPVKDPEELAKGVELVLHHPEIGQRWVEAGKQVVRSFSRENMAKGILRHYEEIIASEKN